MLKKTKKLRVKIETPFLDKGSILNPEEHVGYRKYPEMFEEVFEFPNGEMFCLGDTVYRIVLKGFEEVVKPVKLSEVHISGEVEVFPSRELANKKLKEIQQLRQENYKRQDMVSAMQYISLHSNPKDFEKLSLAEIKRKLETIHKLSTNRAWSNS